MTDPSQQLARANVMLDLRRYREAAALLAALVATERDSALAWGLLSRACLGASQYQEAITAARRAGALNPASDWPYRLLANALLAAGSKHEALQAARAACRLAPHSWQGHCLVAQAAMSIGLAEVAAQANADARRLGPDEPVLYVQAGRVSLAAGDLTEARRHCERALALDPANSAALNQLGRIRFRSGDDPGAAQHFLRAARSAPTEPAYGHNLGVVVRRIVSWVTHAAFLATVLGLCPMLSNPGQRDDLAAAIIAFAALAAAVGSLMVWRLPREVRPLLRSRPVAAATGVSFGSIIAAVALVVAVPVTALNGTVAGMVLLVLAARLGGFALLRHAARKSRGQDLFHHDRDRVAAPCADDRS